MVIDSKDAFMIPEWVFIIVRLLSYFRHKELPRLRYPFQPVLESLPVLSITPPRLMIFAIFVGSKHLDYLIALVSNLALRR